MLKKHTFPKDWSKLTMSEVAENIQYLQRHHRKYKITKMDSKTIKIGTVAIYRDAVQTKYGFERFATIRGNTVAANKYPDLYANIDKLYNDCERMVVPLTSRLKTRARDWWADNRDVAIVATSALSIVTLFVIIFGYAKTKEQKEQEKIHQEQQQKEMATQELQDRIKRSLQKSEIQQITDGTYIYANDSLKQNTR